MNAVQVNILHRLMTEVNGGTFISIITETHPKLAGGKANPQQGRITKRQVGSSVMVFQNKTTNAYENMVNKRLQQEGVNPQFSVGPRQWGTRVPNTPFVTHDDKLYLEVIFLKAGPVEYLLDGSPIKHHDVVGLPPEREEGYQGGLENKVIIRTFNVDSIKGMTINKQFYDFR